MSRLAVSSVSFRQRPEKPRLYRGFSCFEAHSTSRARDEINRALACMSPKLALSGHAELHWTYPLLGVSGHAVLHCTCLLLTQSGHC